MESPASGAPNNKGPAEAKAGRFQGWNWTLIIIGLISIVATPISFIVVGEAWQRHEERQLSSKTIYWTQGNDVALGGGFYMRLYTVTNPNRVKIPNVSLLVKTSEMPKAGRLWFETYPMCVKKSEWQENPPWIEGTFSYNQGGETALPAGGFFIVEAIWRNVLWRNKTTPNIQVTLDVRGVRPEKLSAGTPPPPVASDLPSLITMSVYGLVVAVAFIIGLKVGASLRRGKYKDVEEAVTKGLDRALTKHRDELLRAPEAAREGDSGGQKAASED